MARTDEERGVWHPANSITALPEDDVAFYRQPLAAARSILELPLNSIYPSIHSGPCRYDIHTGGGGKITQQYVRKVAWSNPNCGQGEGGPKLSRSYKYTALRAMAAQTEAESSSSF